MKKTIYLLLALLGFVPNMATEKVTTSLLVASSLVLSGRSSQGSLANKGSLHLSASDDKQVFYLILDNFLREARIKIVFPNNMRVCIHSFFIDKEKKDGLGLGFGQNGVDKEDSRGSNVEEMVTLLLTRPKMNVNSKDKRGYTGSGRVTQDMLEHDKHSHLSYINLWHTLVAKGAKLNEYKTEDKALDRNNSRENDSMDNNEGPKEDE